MELKECYVSSNGISCITNINTLHNFKFNNININKIINKNNVLYFLTLRSTEVALRFLIKNKFFLTNINFEDEENILPAIIFS
tara:strand:+ start:1935 stop:2183 length:249 start_codon:yes stop_codon:yes gene_type:complete